MPNKTLIVIAGPTAIGKTALAIEVAKHYNTEIISADSRQFYIEMSIGTAKPTLAELMQAKHHFVNSHHITDSFTAGDFEKNGLTVLDHIFSKRDIAVLAGGSGLFVQAICNGFDDLPTAPPAIREQLNDELAQFGIESLQAKLQQLDPLYYSHADTHNPQRIIRALEICIASGKPYSSFRIKNQQKRPFNIIKICLNTDREQLYKQINQRVDLMINAGLVDEVKSLIKHQHLNALNTVGYTEIFDYLNKKITLAEAIDAIKQNTRRFAKRQLTWFRKDQDMKWFKPDAQEVLKYLDTRLK